MYNHKQMENTEITEVLERYANLVLSDEDPGQKDFTDDVLRDMAWLETCLTDGDADICISRRKNRCTCRKSRENCLCTDDEYSHITISDLSWGSNCTLLLRMDIQDLSFKTSNNMGWTLFCLHKLTDEEILLLDCFYEKPKKNSDQMYSRWIILATPRQNLRVPISTYRCKDQRIELAIKYMDWEENSASVK